MQERGSWFYEVCGALTRLLIWLLSRFEIYGIEHVPRTGPVIFAANHLSNADPIIIAAVLPRASVFMAKEELLRIPGMAWMTKAYGSFTVRRGAADREAIRRALDVLGEGRALGLFPEGTRSKSGSLGEPFAGVGMLALRTGATIVPIGITGTDDVSPLKVLWRRPRVVLRIGPPIPTVQVTGGLKNVAHERTERVMSAIAALLPEERRGRFIATADAVV